MSSNIHFAMGGAIFGAFTTESAELIAKHGLPGVEPYRSGLIAWLDDPQALKALLDEHGIRLITASNGGPRSVDGIHRSVKTSGNNRRSRRLLPRIPEDLRLYALQDQHGKPPAERNNCG